MIFKKLNHPGNDLFVGVFYYIVTSIFNFVNFCIWKVLLPSLQIILRKTEIPHSPGDHHRTIPKISQL